MNQYLTKEQYESVKVIFRWIHEKLDVNKKMSFDFITSHVHQQKFGNQQERVQNGFNQFESDYENSDLNPHTKQSRGSQEDNDDEEEIDSDQEFINLNYNLKQGKSGARGVSLGEESLQNNARYVISNENNLDDFDRNSLTVPSNFAGEGFRSFEGAQQTEPIQPQNTNSIFSNQLKPEENNQTNYLNDGYFQKQNKHEIHVGNGPERIKAGLSFGNNSFDIDGSDQDKIIFKRSSFGENYDLSLKKSEEDFKNNLLGIGMSKTEENLLSSKTLGGKTPSYDQSFKIKPE